MRLSFFRTILLLLFIVLFCDKTGLMTGQKSSDFGSPSHLSRKYIEMDSLLTFVFYLRKLVKFFQISCVLYLL